jgi:hypothetical protein
MNEQTIQNIISQELEKAERARIIGKEGMARVCARRAVGIAIGEYFNRKGYINYDGSAYNRLRELVNFPHASTEMRQAASLLLLRVTQEHNLPIEVDLIAEARWLIGELLS